MTIKCIDYYGLVYFLKHIQADEETAEQVITKGVPDKVVLLKDSKPYWRTEVFPAYKANRVSIPDPAFRYYTQMLEEDFSYIPLLSTTGLEADDLAGLVCRLSPGKERIVLLTSDSDWLQLVDDSRKIVWSNFRSYPNHIWDESRVKSKVVGKEGNWISHPKDLAIIKYMKGDRSDNIPPQLPDYDLVSLQGQGWYNSLNAAGIDVKVVEQEITDLLF